MRRKKKTAETGAQGSTVFIRKEEELFTRRMENGYDLCYPKYMQWLQIFHQEEAMKLAAAPRLGSSCTNEAPVTSSGVKSQSKQHPSACSLVDKVSRPVNSQPTSHDKVHALSLIHI